MLERKMVEELDRLKILLGLGYGLKVKWLPKADGKLSGEVKGHMIYVYSENEVEALQTLKHEFLDFSLSQIIEPYMTVTNRLIELINEDAYKRKEKLVEALTKLL